MEGVVAIDSASLALLGGLPVLPGPDQRAAAAPAEPTRWPPADSVRVTLGTERVLEGELLGGYAQGNPRRERDWQNAQAFRQPGFTPRQPSKLALQAAYGARSTPSPGHRVDVYA